MTVIDIGERVDMGEGLYGIITAICIRDKHITYEVVWWSGRERKCVWIEECEIYSKTTRDYKRLQITSTGI